MLNCIKLRVHTYHTIHYIHGGGSQEYVSRRSACSSGNLCPTRSWSIVRWVYKSLFQYKDTSTYHLEYSYIMINISIAYYIYTYHIYIPSWFKFWRPQLNDQQGSLQISKLGVPLFRWDLENKSSQWGWRICVYNLVFFWATFRIF